MGYTTEFKGHLDIKGELTAPQIVALKGIFGEDCRDHPEWNEPDLYYVDLELTDDFAGIKHDGSEKTHGLEQCVNLVIRLMRERWPDFSISGSMIAQGEEVDDRWSLAIGEDGFAHKQEIVVTGTKVKCPHCAKTFSVEA